jgi:mediator of RNA polymerase II transcription subunit 21
MLEELSSMDRITQLQDEIQNASALISKEMNAKADTKWARRHWQLLTIMSRSIAYLTSRVNFVQVSDEIPITKQRNPEKVDPPDVFEGPVNQLLLLPFLHTLTRSSPSISCGFLPRTRTEQQTRRS